MALLQQTMSEKNLEAHRRNAQLSHGAATPEGKERARAANLRHGYYSQLRNEALAALGEDPEALAALVEGAHQQFRPANAYQAWITDRLASLQWRIQRAERMQESQAATHVRQAEAKRRLAAQQLREQGADVEDFLASLQRAVARPDFYAPDRCFQECDAVLQQNPSALMEHIVELMHQLRKPRRFAEPPPPPLPEAMSDPEWQEALSDSEAGESSLPDPEIKVAEGKERDPLREQLWKLAGEERRRAAEAWGRAIAAQEAPLSTRARDVLVMQISKEMELMRREERACFREFSRLGKDLMKLQQETAAPDQRVKDREQPPRTETADQMGAAGENESENEGASGYVEENTGDPNFAGSTKYPLEARRPQPEAAPRRDILTERLGP